MIKVISEDAYRKAIYKPFSIRRDFNTSDQVTDTYLDIKGFDYKVVRSYKDRQIVQSKYYILERTVYISAFSPADSRIGINYNTTFSKEYFKFSGRLIRITKESQLVLDCSTENHAILITVDPLFIKIDNVIEVEVELDEE